MHMPRPIRGGGSVTSSPEGSSFIQPATSSALSPPTNAISPPVINSGVGSSLRTPSPRIPSSSVVVLPTSGPNAAPLQDTRITPNTARRLSMGERMAQRFTGTTNLFPLQSPLNVSVSSQSPANTSTSLTPNATRTSARVPPSTMTALFSPHTTRLPSARRASRISLADPGAQQEDTMSSAEQKPPLPPA